MWVLLALGSAVFAGITSVLAKCGIKNTDSAAATAIRTAVVLLMSFVMVLIAGSLGQIADISAKSWIFLVLSGLATGASWLCYFRALQLGDVNKVVPVDKSSTVLTLLFAFIVLGEPISWLKGICVVLIGAGTYLMTEKKKDKGDEGGQKKEKGRVAALCRAVRRFCGAYLHSCKDRHRPSRIKPCYDDTHGGGAGDVVCMRVCHRERGRTARYPAQGAAVYMPLRACDGGKLAVLL